MNPLNQISEFILDSNFRITIFEDKINIINYNNIDIFENDRIVVNNKIKIIGKNLSIVKLLADELLIKGEILKVIFG